MELIAAQTHLAQHATRLETLHVGEDLGQAACLAAQAQTATPTVLLQRQQGHAGVLGGRLQRAQQGAPVPLQDTGHRQRGPRLLLSHGWASRATSAQVEPVLGPRQGVGGFGGAGLQHIVFVQHADGGHHAEGQHRPAQPAGATPAADKIQRQRGRCATGAQACVLANAVSRCEGARCAVARCIEELNREDIGTVMGLHPEGTRGKGADPYTFLPAQPGVGRIALGATLIYGGSYDGTFYAWDARNGKVRWKHRAEGRISGGAVVLGTHLGEIPTVLSMVFRGAFTGEAALGGTAEAPLAVQGDDADDPVITVEMRVYDFTDELSFTGPGGTREKLRELRREVLGGGFVPNLPNKKVAWNGGRLIGPQNEYPAADWPTREAISKRYLNAMVLDYSGEAYFYFWAQHRLNLEKAALLHVAPIRLGQLDRKSTRLNSSHQI